MSLIFNGPIQSIKNFNNPNDISGTILWLDAADTSTITKDVNNNVTQWQDKSGKGNHFINGSTNYPKSGTKTFNNLNLIDLQTNTNSYLVSSSSAITVNTSYSMFIVCYSSSTGTTSYMRPNSLTSGINTDNIWAISQNSNTKMYCLIGSGSGSWNNTTTYNTNFQNLNIISFITNCTIDISNVGVTVQYVNGLLNATQSTPLAGNPYNVSSTTQIWIGAGGSSSANAAQFIAGTVAEVIIYNNVALSASYRQRIEGYLAWKWRIQSYLPSTHPMINIPSFMTCQSFNPKSISNILLWLDASDRSTIILNSSNYVLTWNDKSGNGYNFNKYGTSNITTGKYFDVNNVINNGWTDNFQNASIVINNTFSIFIVGYTITNSTYAYSLTSNAANVGHLNNTINDNASIGGTNYSINGIGSSITNHINEILYDKKNIEFYRTGNLLNSTPCTATTNYTAGINLGNINTSGYNWQGTFCEIIIYNKGLSTSERQIVEGYLAWKWNINSDLPINHPYYSYFPFSI